MTVARTQGQRRKPRKGMVTLQVRVLAHAGYGHADNDGNEALEAKIEAHLADLALEAKKISTGE
jgi:hypothetical protein